MKDDKMRLLWGIQNNGKFHYTHVEHEEGFPWCETTLHFRDSSFIGSDLVGQAIKKYPDSYVEEKEVDMVEFSKQYVSVLLSTKSDIGHNINTKTILQMIKIIYSKKEIPLQDMWSNDQVYSLSGGYGVVHARVYCFIRDNQKLFVG